MTARWRWLALAVGTLSALSLAEASMARWPAGWQVSDLPAAQPGQAGAGQRQPLRRVCACLTVYPPLRVPPRPAGAARGAPRNAAGVRHCPAPARC
ncbi:DUF4946 domain-containing protein [Pseudomonas aeruginosa]|uniref:DUF4946 domain-containing protein n=1 Tax=Pseudomonas aeruginosa TaxID=287 RepID=UPI0035A0E9C0